MIVDLLEVSGVMFLEKDISYSIRIMRLIEFSAPTGKLVNPPRLHIPSFTVNGRLSDLSEMMFSLCL